MAAIRTVEELERIYGAWGAVGEASKVKVADHHPPLPPVHRRGAIRCPGHIRSGGAGLLSPR